MIKLIEKTAKYSRKKAGDSFIILAQNGLSIMDDASDKWREKYLEIIDGVGLEDLFFNITDKEDQSYRLRLIKPLFLKNKLILNVEYIPKNMHKKYFDILKKHPYKFIGYSADPDKLLDKLVIY
ncbi:MAG: hypothetical protein ABIE74_08910 [Pseudomonadota bacterium]